VSPLTYIFNRIIDSGIYPSILKNAKMSPIFKSGEKWLPTNHRPISVLPVISKVIEKHISKHMYQYLAKYNLLHDAQPGFRSNYISSFLAMISWSTTSKAFFFSSFYLDLRV
jgi:hypothetical protein